MTTAIFTLAINASPTTIDRIVEHLEFCDISYAISRGTHKLSSTIISVSAEVQSQAGAQELVEMIECAISEAGSPYTESAKVLVKNW